jgi:hypothetical protein
MDLTKRLVSLLAVFALCTIPLMAASRSKTTSHHTTHPAIASTAHHSTHSQAGSSHAARSRSAATASSKHGSADGRKTAQKRRPRGQQEIDSARATEIQQALIREGYLSGEATGVWDQSTKEALVRFQSDNHWQNKIVPDSRALIKLGLGPSQQNLLNPESAAIAMPARSSESN